MLCLQADSLWCSQNRHKVEGSRLRVACEPGTPEQTVKSTYVDFDAPEHVGYVGFRAPKNFFCGLAAMMQPTGLGGGGGGTIPNRR